MKKLTNNTIIIILLICVLGVVVFKIYNVKKTSIRNTDIEGKNIPMMIDLGSDTCIPCKQMIPVLDEVKSIYKGKAVIKFININDDSSQADKYGIRVIPTQVFLDKDGKEVYRHEGFFPKKDIIKTFDKMGVN